MVFLFAYMSMFTHQMLDAASYWLMTFALVSTRAQWTVPRMPQRGGRRRGTPAMPQCTHAAGAHNLKQRSGTQP
jgi:hypothetical protein